MNGGDFVCGEEGSLSAPENVTVFGSVQQVQQDNRLADPSNSPPPLPFLFFIISFRNERREEKNKVPFNLGLGLEGMFSRIALTIHGF